MKSNTMLESMILVLISFLMQSCGGDSESGIPADQLMDACGNPTNITVNDKRCLYQVSTLTEAFNGSGGLVVDSQGFIYVGDFGDALSNANGTTISKIDPETGVISFFANGLEGASGNTISEDGQLYQANIRGQSISLVSSEGAVSTYAEDGLISPVGLAFDEGGNLFACNCGGGGSIQKIDANGTSSRFSESALLDCPNGLTMDDSGNLYAANFNNSDVIKISVDGSAEVFAKLPGSSNAHIAFGNGDLYVLSRNGNKLYEVSLDGEISLIAGTGSSGNVDGSAEASTFFVPNGIDLSPDGSKIYVTSGIPGQGTELNPVVVRVVELK